MKKTKVIRLNENDLERMVNRIINEEKTQEKQGLTENMGGTHSIAMLDEIISTTRELKTKFENFANSVTGTGYSDEIDGVTKKINDLEGKFLDVKSKAYKFMSQQKEQGTVKKKQEVEQQVKLKREQDAASGKPYSY